MSKSRRTEKDDVRSEDLDLVNGLGSDAPDFLGDSDLLTPEEEALLEADMAGATESGDADGDVETSGDTGDQGKETVGGTDEGAGETDDNTDDDIVAGSEEGDESDGGDSRTVNHGAFHKERERRKAAESELAELRDKYARGDERLKVLQEIQSKNAELEEADAVDEDPRPDPEDDVFAFIEWQGREIERLKEAGVKTSESVEEGRKQSELNTEHAGLVNSYQRAATEFVGEKPDFGEAYQFLIASRKRELGRLGYSDAEQAQTINSDEMTIVRNAMKKGENPAAVMYEIAEERGYTLTKAPSGDDDIKDEGADTKKAEEQAKASAKEKTDQMEALQRSEDAATSLSSLGGSGVAELTIETLAAMSDSEFNALHAKHEAEIDRVMGA